MRKPIDPVVKALVETSPPDWLPLVGLPRAPTTVIDADISTVLAGAADKVLHVHAKPAYLLHLDFQSGHDSARFPRRLRLYNTALDDRHELLVRSVVVLLHPGADSPQLTGIFERAFPGEPPYAFWRYQVLRVWELSVNQLLAGGLGSLPLAPISAVSEADLPWVIEQMQQRLRQPAERRLAPELWAATYILLGMRYSTQLADLMLSGVREMEESVTYQAIVKKGMAQGVAQGVAQGLAEGSLRQTRKLLLRLGEARLGQLDAATRKVINSMSDNEHLENLCAAVSAAKSWNELLGEPSRSRRGGRRKSSQ